MTDGGSEPDEGPAAPSDGAGGDGGPTGSDAVGGGASGGAVRTRRCVAVALADGRVVDATGSLTDALGLGSAVAAGEADFYDGLAAAATDPATVERMAADGATADGSAADGATVTVETDGGERVYRHAAASCPADAADRVALFEDVTRLDERADRLDRFEALAERARDGLLATDGAGRVAYCNESFAARLGADPATLAGRPVERLVAERERPAWAAAVADLDPETEQTREVAFDWRGPRVELSVALTGRPGGGVLVAARCPDGERERADRTDGYRRLVESAADPMWVVDADDRIALANGAMGEFLGADPASLEGRPVTDPVPDEAAERITAALAAVRAGDRRRWHDTDLRLPDDDGRSRRFEATFGPVRADGRVVGTVGTFRDVTERERRRSELEQLRRLLAGVVRTDVAAGVREIGALAERLADRVDGEPARLAAAIGERADSLAALVTKTAAVERIVDTDPEPTTVALDEAVERAVAALDCPQGATLDVDVPAVDVRAVPVVDLAVRNLVENALDHAGDASTVSVTGTVDGRSVTLAVVDDGPGIPDAEISALERGAETPLEHGSGVGLWLVEWVVTKSGADLSFDTADGTRAAVRFDRAGAGGGPLAGSDADRAVEDADVRVCHLDPDRSATARIREAAAAVDPTVAVERVGGVDAAVDVLAGGGVDCLVTDRLDDSEWDSLVAAADEADAPVVCYAAAAHAGDGERLAAVDSLVEKGTGTAPAAFLVEKLLALTGESGTRRAGAPTDGDGQATDGGADEAGESTDAAGAAGAAVAVATETGTATRVPDGHPGLAEGSAPPAEGAAAAVRSATAGATRRRVGEWGLELTVDGETLGVRYARDLTAAVERERRCALLSALVDHARDCISVVDANGEVVYHNEAFADLLGHGDMVGTHSAAFMAPGELEKGQLAVQRLLATPRLDSEVLDVDFVTADGERVTLALEFAVRREDGEYAGVVNVARDVTGASADPRLERARTLVECAGDPMFVVDADGRLTLVNEALERLFGRPRSALRGTHVAELFPTVTADGEGSEDGDRGASEADGTDEWWRPGAERVFCARIRGADGDRHRYAVTVADPEEFDGAVCTCREVTTRERRADELARLKGVLGRVLRHNLRNELTLVTGHAQLIADALGESDDGTGPADGTADGPSADARAGDGPADCEDPLALARSIQGVSDDLAATATTARAAERALERRDGERSQSLSTVVEAAAEAAAQRRGPLTVTATLPDGLSVRAPASIVTAFEALFGALAGGSDTDSPTVRVRATEADGRVDCRVSLGTGSVAAETVEPFAASPEAVLDDHRDAGAWLFARVLDWADGRARVDDSDRRRTVVVSLPVADGPVDDLRTD